MNFPPAKSLIVASSLLGLLFGVAFATQAVDLNASLAWIGLAAIVSALAAGAIFNVALRRVVLPVMESFSRSERAWWALGCLAAGFYIIWIIPLQVYPKPQVIKISATGEKNSAAKSSEVWLERLTTGGQAMPLQMDDCAGDWARMYARFRVSTVNVQPAQLVCTIGTLDDVSLHFLTHEWSGEVQVRYAGQVDALDLYSAAGGSRDLVVRVTPSRTDRLISALLFLVDGVTAAFLLLVWLLFWVQRRPGMPRPGPARWLAAGAYAALLFLVWSGYLLVYWPGNLTPDSINQFVQVSTNTYINWHPPIHTLLLALTTRLWFSPVPMIVLQLVCQAVALAWGLALLAERGAPPWITAGLAVFLSLSPGVAQIAITLWKDIPYTIVVLVMSLMILYLLGRPDEKVGAGFWIAMTLVAILVALLRQNGPVVAFGSLLLLAVVLRRRPPLAALAVSVPLTLLIIGPIYDALHIQKTLLRQGNNVNVITSMLLFPSVHVLNYHRSSGTPLLPQEEAFLAAVLPDGSDGEMAFGLLKGKEAWLLRSAARVTSLDPGITLDYFLTKISFIFQILQPENVRVEYAGGGVDENSFGFKSESQIPALKPLGDRVLDVSKRPVFDWFFWRNAFWMYLMLASAVVACVRLKNWKNLLIIAPTLLNAIPLVLFTGGHLARYIYPTLLLGPLFGIGLLWIRPAPAAGRPAVQTDVQAAGERAAEAEMAADMAAAEARR